MLRDCSLGPQDRRQKEQEMVVAAAVVTVAVTRRRRRRCGGIGGGRWRRERPRARTTWPRLDQPDPSHEHARPRLDRAGLVSTNPDRLQGRMVVPFRSGSRSSVPARDHGADYRRLRWPFHSARFVLLIVFPRSPPRYQPPPPSQREQSTYVASHLAWLHPHFHRNEYFSAVDSM